MIIEQSIYNKILSQIKPAPPESGGIIGEKGGIITHFLYDGGLMSRNTGCYVPDIYKLNRVLLQWRNKGIKFCGIIHSHINNQTELSGGDIKYIYQILLNMPECYTRLYFPLVVKGKLIAYRAKHTVNGIDMIREKVKILRIRQS
jgi:hypothetical protein